MTEKGLKYINWGWWVFAIGLIIVLIVGMFIIAVRNDGNIAISSASLGIAILTVLSSLLWIILLFIGFLNMVKGKHEYGSVHLRNVNISQICIFLFVAISIAAIFFYPHTSGEIIGTGENEGGMETFQVEKLLYTMSLFLSLLFFSFAWVFLILELASDRIRKLLCVWFFINAVGLMITLITYFWALNAIGSIIIAYCYRDTYNHVKNRVI